MSSATRAPAQRRIPWCAAALVLAGVALTSGAATAQPTFTVTNTADSGAGSLRQAVLDANARVGVDAIGFNIPGTGPHVITLATALPNLIGPVTIDGSSQPGYAGTPVIELDGSASTPNDYGLTIHEVDNTEIKALRIGSFATGILVNANAPLSDNRFFDNVVRSSTIGIFLNSHSGGSHHGYTIESNDLGGAATGIYALGLVDTVIPGSNVFAGTQTAISIKNGARVTLEDVDVSGAGGTGIVIDRISDCTVQRVDASGRDTGILFTTAIPIANNTIQHNVARNTTIGIFLSSHSSGSHQSYTIESNDLGGAATGIYAIGVFDTVIPGSNTLSGTQTGIVCKNGARITVEDVDVSGSGGTGVVFDRTGDSTIQRVDASGRTTGIQVGTNIAVSNNRILNNVARDTGIGIFLAAARGSHTSYTIATNDLVGAGTGIRAFHLFDTVIPGSNTFANNSVGIYLTGGGGNTIEDVDVSGTGGEGVILETTSDNTIQRVTASGRNRGIRIKTNVPVEDNTVRDCVIHDADIGLYVESSPAGSHTNYTVAGNDISSGTAGGHAILLLETYASSISANTIRDNLGTGIGLVTGAEVSIRGNSIAGNGLLGIDIGNNGLTPNDPLDADTGPNGYQNFPVLTTASGSSFSTRVDGTLDSAPGGSYTIEFFASTACDPSDHGEGESYLGASAVVTDGAGHAAFSATLPIGGSTGYVTATATDAAGSTSEFSACVPRVASSPPPDPNLSGLVAHPTILSAFGGQADITVTPRDAYGDLIGSGLSVTVATTLGSLDPTVVDNLDGTYSQTLTGAGTGGTAVVTATVEGVPLATSAVVTLVPVDPALSTIVVTPTATYLGGHATVTVIPVDDLGQSAGAGLGVVIQTTLGTLVGTVLDHGDGTYSQGIDATALGTASITATVHGLPLDVSAWLTVSDPANLGNIIGLQTDGTAFPDGSIQAAVDDATANSLVKILVAPGVHEEIVHVKKLGTPLELEALSALSLVTVRGFHVDKSADVTIGYFDIDADGKNKHGIAVKGTDKDPTAVIVHDSLVHGTKKGHAGVRAKGESTALVLTDCQVFQNGDDGVEVLHEATLTMTTCTVASNGDNGVKLEKHAVATISGCTIRDNGLNGSSKKGYGIFRKRDGQGGAPRDVTLIQNVLTGNRGKVVPGTSDAQLGNHDQILDPTDQQPGY